MSKTNTNLTDYPTLTRSEVANILGCTVLTISNREKKGLYPDPDRDINNYRVYHIEDIMALQLKTFSKIDPRPILSCLYDKGYRDYNQLGRIIDESGKRKGIKN